MEVTVWKHAAACNVSPIVNRFPICDHQIRTERNEFIQIQHRAVFLPEEPVEFKRLPAISGSPDDLATHVHRVSHTAYVITNGTEVGHHSVAPNECMKFFVVCS